MEPKIKYKPGCPALTESFGVDPEELKDLIVEAHMGTEYLSDVLAKIWHNAPSPQHALLGAFFVGCMPESRLIALALLEVFNGRHSGQGTPDA